MSCTNNGRQPLYQQEGGDYYSFKTLEECCQTWFIGDPHCVVMPSSSSDMFFPDHSRSQCGSKPFSDFQDGEELFTTLDECCDTKYPNDKANCCSVEGLGGCQTSGMLLYIPDWLNHKCESKDTAFVLESEEIFAYDSMSECCEKNYPYDGGAGCKTISST
eukprot:CAMPEP_0183754302 /NCGR_PEP_ID=MMETSP0739-20130205/3462_1 /TAXON_ID=385413 /ORGANISM="Thalassiosira miniscula, Strain CCMP1093" /LENGTH=160 /DNA_ID=CAMNT_0025990913 /DNA_START=41 /DNA_END=523 /DNA_ORIENTATION=-